MNIETIRFANDTATRKRLMVPESFAHPAKGQLGMWATMIERYSAPGDTVLDPMSGSGATLLAALMGRSALCIELEAHFVEPMRRSWEKMRQMPMMGCTMGEAVILRGDARALPLPDASAGTVVTSLPYENSELPREEHDDTRFDGVHPRYRYTRHVGEGSENIGNQKGDAYWRSMAQVYAECWRVLRPGGIMALVLKGFTRKGQYVDLPGQTEALLLAAGWVKHDHWRRELWSLSFWRILQQRRDPAAFDDRLKYEEVLAFRKPNGAGKGIDAVITSPPFEDQVPNHLGGKTDFSQVGGIGHERVSGYTDKPKRGG